MKRELEVAAELFRQNEALSGGPGTEQERANLYRGLALLAEGLHKIEKRFERLDPDGAGRILRSAGVVRRKLRARLVLAPRA